MPEILTANIENPSIIKSFLKKYRKISAVTSSNLPTACLLEGIKRKNINELKEFKDDEDVFVYWDEADHLRFEKINNIIYFWENRKPWEDYDFCIFPDTLDWCIGFTHNDYCILKES